MISDGSLCATFGTDAVDVEGGVFLNVLVDAAMPAFKLTFVALTLFLDAAVIAPCVFGDFRIGGVGGVTGVGFVTDSLTSVVVVVEIDGVALV